MGRWMSVQTVGVVEAQQVCRCRGAMGSILTCCVLVGALVAPGWAGQGPPEIETTPPQPTTESPADNKAANGGTDGLTDGESRRLDRQRSIEGARRNMWWNRPRMIASLELAAEQRQAMDGILRAYLEHVLGAKDRPKPPNHFRRGLLDGDFAAARRGLETIGERARIEGMREGEMMLEILGLLSPEQMDTLLGRHRRLLNRSWLLLVPGQGGGRGQGGRMSRSPGTDGRQMPRDGGS